MNPKYLRILAIICVVTAAVLSILSLKRFGTLTPSPLRTTLLIIGVILLVVARRNGARC